MSKADAVAFLDRVESDKRLSAALAGLVPDSSAVLATVHSAGFDVTESELHEAAAARYGTLLTPELEEV